MLTRRVISHGVAGLSRWLEGSKLGKQAAQINKHHFEPLIKNRAGHVPVQSMSCYKRTFECPALCAHCIVYVQPRRGRVALSIGFIVPVWCKPLHAKELLQQAATFFFAHPACDVAFMIERREL